MYELIFLVLFWDKTSHLKIVLKVSLKDQKLLFLVGISSSVLNLSITFPSQW